MSNHLLIFCKKSGGYNRGMWERKELKTNLLGTLEMALLMPQGVKRFNNDMSAMFRSFWLIPIVMPFTLYAIHLMQPNVEQIANLSYGFVAVMFTFKILVVTVLTLLLGYGFAKHYERMEHFCLTVTALNWSGLINTVLFLPAVVMVGSGAYAWDDIYAYLVFLSLYPHQGSRQDKELRTFPSRPGWHSRGASANFGAVPRVSRGKLNFFCTQTAMRLFDGAPNT